MEIDVVRVSSKGQIVIPLDMRKGIREGDRLLVVRSGDQIVLKKANKLEKEIERDIEFARRTVEALKQFEEGKFRSMDYDEFMEKLKHDRDSL